jgi:hypothetical protein
MMRRIIPFILSLGGVLSDYLTTRIGVSLGFYELHPHYNPILALFIFWGAVALLTVTLPKKRLWNLSINGLASVSYLGMINNILVILGIFSGLVL